MSEETKDILESSDNFYSPVSLRAIENMDQTKFLDRIVDIEEEKESLPLPELPSDDSFESDNGTCQSGDIIASKENVEDNLECHSRMFDDKFQSFLPSIKNNIPSLTLDLGRLCNMNQREYLTQSIYDYVLKLSSHLKIDIPLPSVTADIQICSHSDTGDQSIPDQIDDDKPSGSRQVMKTKSLVPISSHTSKSTNSIQPSELSKTPQPNQTWEAHFKAFDKTKPDLVVNHATKGFEGLDVINGPEKLNITRDKLIHYFILDRLKTSKIYNRFAQKYDLFSPSEIK